MGHTTRAIAAEILLDVLAHGRSLTAALPGPIDRLDDPRDRALAQELCFGVMRQLPRLQAIVTRLMKKALKKKDTDIFILLLLGVYQLLHLRLPPHAAVDETVAVARGKPWAKGLVNGVLRNFLRRREEIIEAVDREVPARFAHPPWLVTEIRNTWPENWENILRENNRRAPMVLRVNARRVTREDYLGRYPELGEPAPGAESTIRLHKAMDVDRIPGFAAGIVSVQDGGAQLAAELLELAPGQRVLDACAAPGGKGAHILEREPGLASLVAIERDPARLARLEATLTRLGLGADLHCADAGAPEGWWDGRCFDRILLDAPCSGSGIIRRHPDVKFHRRPGDIPQYAVTQARLLHALWPLLAPGGRLLYVTCSIFSQENRQRIRRFLKEHPDAVERPIDAGQGLSDRDRLHGGERYPGYQILPGENGMDGFYYARIEKIVIG
ncbi:MAG: 16S rRNA m(5)C-967 methyltransferase [Candidatus Kentron sp. G]|nr:MAG: 16S rRNA m(5)C-967 methyltransferase [Candidatus Kentron sp. G]VFM95623.1 MAG: 16S rRNA m(5)C-967 methyltransferase [Candidatus Kentron sp. G]VFM99882.1 MAG: 16S rRNA m(5)C-967 methyltransferase [Candidatus Kentron sp. G]